MFTFNLADVAQLVRAPVCGTGGRGFNPHHSPQNDSLRRPSTEGLFVWYSGGMPHIHTEPDQYDITASGYIIRLDGPEPVIVMHMHKILHQYLQFGGHVELKETLWDAVIHEVSEESGYAMSQLKILQPDIPSLHITDGILHPSPVSQVSIRFGDTNHFHTDIAYAFTTHEAPSGKVSEDESSEMKTFTASELAALPTGAIPENVREVALFIFKECLANWEETDPATFQTGNPGKR
jgi:8-oxo-dGTP diphosphatase